MKNLLIYFSRRIFSLVFRIKMSIMNLDLDNVNWEVNIMTDEEIRIGKELRNKVNEVYTRNPARKKFKKGMDRYEMFLIKMSEKYNVSTLRVREELFNSRG